MANRIAVIFRSYAKKAEQLDEVVARAVSSARQASELKIGEEAVFNRVIFLVPMDYDCGSTAERLLEAMKQNGLLAEVFMAKGHHSCGALNEALMKLDDMDYAAIVSNKAAGYMTPEVIDKAIMALNSGAKVVGVQIKELSDIEEQPIENTLALWNVRDLLKVGGFDSEIGVEEVAPMVRLMKAHGRCAGIVQGSHEAKLDVRQSADGKARHAEVRDTKRERQAAEADRMGVSLDWIRSNIQAL